MAVRVWAKWLVPSLGLLLACGSSNKRSGPDPDVPSGSGGTGSSKPGIPSKGGGPQVPQAGGEGPIEAGAGPGPGAAGAPPDVGGAAGEAGVPNVPDVEPGIRLIASGDAMVHESFGRLQFQLILTTAPAADVTVELKSADTKYAVVSPLKLLFTPQNWNMPQSAFVSGVKDQVADGDHAVAIETLPAISKDARYAGIDAEDLVVWVVDDTDAGIAVGAVSGNTSEAGTQAKFYVVLTSKPTAKVVIPMASSDTTEGTVPPELVFDPSNWSEPQAATITGVDDQLVDGNQPYTIKFGAVVSNDEVYAGRTLAAIQLFNLDNDSAGARRAEP